MINYNLLHNIILADFYKIFLYGIKMTTISISSNIYVRNQNGTTEYSSSDTFTNTTQILDWPVTLNNSSNPSQNVNVNITNDLTLTTLNHYFIMGSNNITFDGQNNKVIINGVTNYLGLIENGVNIFTNGKNNIIIQNLGVETTNNSSLLDNAGWIGHEFMNINTSGCQVINCYSSGRISGDYAGGIFGSQSIGTATNCYSTGAISGNDAGGIFGSNSSGTVTNCYSSGDIIGFGAGGIFGPSLSCTATNCYSTGDISGLRAGGIFGDSSSGTVTNCYSSGAISGGNSGGIFGAFSSGTATNCYSLGAISGDYAGGIFGSNSSFTSKATNCYSSGDISGTWAGGISGPNSTGCTATNCYSTGDISGENSGGIFGFSVGSVTAKNCYSTGAISGNDAGGIFGYSSSGSGISQNCYSANGSWIDSAASSALQNAPTYSPEFIQGTIWIDFNLSATNIPWSLGSFNGPIYNPNTINRNVSGTTGSGIITTGVEYQIIDVNNTLYDTNNFTGITNTGDITFTGLTNGTTYIIRVLRKNAISVPPVGYQINTLTIAIDSVSPTVLSITRSKEGTTLTFDPNDINNKDTITVTLSEASTNFVVGSITVTGGTLSGFSGSGTSYSVLFTASPDSTTQGTITVAAGAFTDAASNNNLSSETLTIPINTIPFTTFSLSPLSINERELYSGSLSSDSTTDPQYTILSQPIDNLYISGNTVIAKYPFNYQEYKTYPVQIGGTASGITIVRSFNIQIVNLPDAPTLVYISNTKIPENSPIDSAVGTLQTYDNDPNDTFTYQFVSGVGSDDNLSFTIENDVLYTTTTFNYNTKNTYSIRVKTTDSSGLSVENPILLQVVLPTAGSFETSSLVGSTTTITLRGQNVAGGELVYQITRQPAYGSLAFGNDGVFTYVPSTNQQDSFEYVVKEDTMTSLPGMVIIYNYSESDIANIPRNLGTLEFDSISFDGNKWTFGTITTNTFIQDGLYYRLGMMTLMN
jgi:hypothetical protein